MINVYDLNAEERKAMNIEELPSSLLRAVEELESDQLLQDAIGADIYNAFRRVKLEEWDEYRTNVMDWEVERYLETI